MIGLALVTLVAVLAAGITPSFRGAVDELWISGYAITAQNNFAPIPIAAGNAAAKTPGVEAIANVRGGEALIFETVTRRRRSIPGDAQIFRLDWVDGSATRSSHTSAANGAFVDDGFAKTHHLHVGSPLKLTAPTGKTRRPRGARHLRAADRRLAVRAVTISDAAWDSSTTSRRTSTRSSACAAARRPRTPGGARRGSCKTFPDAKVADAGAVHRQPDRGLNAILNVLYVLLALSSSSACSGSSTRSC